MVLFLFGIKIWIMQVAFFGLGLSVPKKVSSVLVTSLVQFLKSNAASEDSCLLGSSMKCPGKISFEPQFPTRSNTNQAVQLQKMARGLKICI